MKEINLLEIIIICNRFFLHDIFIKILIYFLLLYISYFHFLLCKFLQNLLNINQKFFIFFLHNDFLLVGCLKFLM